MTPPRLATAASTGALTLLVLLGTLTATPPLALDMYLPAFPRIADDFDVAEPAVQLSLTACLLGLALGQLVSGPLSDRFGRRRPVIAGVAAYTLASLLCALAPSAAIFTGLRLVQGLAGGVGVVVARAVVRDLYAGPAAARYFSRLTLVFGVAPIAAPLLGSLVLRVTTWHGVFVTLAALGAVLAAAVVWRLPETLPAEHRSDDGLRGTARAARLLVTDRIYVGYALAQGLTFAGMFAYISGSPFVYQDVFGLPDTTFSVLFGLNALGQVTLAQLNARLVGRHPPRRLLLAAVAATLVAALLLLAGAVAGSLPVLVLTLFVIVACVGAVLPNSMALALDRHGRRAGTAAALLGAAQFALGAVAAPFAGLGGATAVPMALTIVATSTLALAAVLTLTRATRTPTPS